MLPIEISDEAGAELAALLIWLEQRNLKASRRAAKAIFRAIDQLAVFPQSAPAIGGGARECTVGFGRDGYTVRYSVEHDRIVVLHVFHGRQDRGAVP